jgi:putative transposase
VETGVLQSASKTAEKRHVGSSVNSIVRHRAQHKDHVWCWDFIFDSDVRGRSLKWLSIVDEFTRECLVLEVDRSITSGEVLDVLTELFLIRGVPKFIRSDNGPEFIADRIKTHLQRANVRAGYIEPGAPWENGYAESFHSRVRDELLNAEEFDGVRDARMHAARWKNDYNHRRPHSSLGYQTPAVFAATCVEATPLRLAALASAPCPQHTMNPQPTLITAGT